MKTIFFGASTYVLPLIEFLHKNYNLTLVVTTESNPTDAVPNYCKKNDIPFLSVKKLDEKTVVKIKERNVPFAILADFRLLVKQAVIDIFPKGIINIHPSLLPEYRGPTPGTTAILDGKEKTGVSLMLLDKDLDHGPILGQVEEKIESHDTSVTLYKRLFKKSVELLEKVLSPYLEGKLEPQEQDHTKATYTEFLTRESGYIEAGKVVDKEKFDHMVRAYSPWPSVWTKWNVNGKRRFEKARHLGGEKIVKFLPNNMVQMEGKKPVSYKDFVNGYSQAKDFLEKMGLI